MYRYVAHEHYRCKLRSMSHEVCSTDDVCMWTDPINGCSFGHDLHNKIHSTLHHCMDSVYHRFVHARRAECQGS